MKWPGNVSVILPAYNEAENIRFAVIIADAVLREIVEDYEIIVVSDGSTDATVSEVQAVAERLPAVRLLEKKQNGGYGFAIRDGFAAARCDHVFFTDADRQFDLVSLRELFPHIADNDIVVGYRLHRQDTLLRRFLSGGYNLAVRTLFDLRVRDVDCAFKLFRRSVFDEIQIESPHYFMNTEILAKARRRGLRIHQVGVHHFRRVQGISKVSWKDIPRTLREMFGVGLASLRQTPKSPTTPKPPR